ncbi:hypothetical protein B4U80_11915 [Leptotrombidium deliense]|uniref:F-box domain-containing protein n=1 Tax=Leptotrombidium deliense TaxID=299467 RepID=A0A443S0U9_9ACAR|nr:hypothetical protein B4U80_11915 [Leptotrombidium deliense]
MLSVLRRSRNNGNKGEFTTNDAEDLTNLTVLLMENLNRLHSGCDYSGPHLLSLPNEVFDQITPFLCNTELLNLRAVSKRLKTVSDYALKSRKRCLVVDPGNESKVEGLFEVYRDLLSLEFCCTKRPFEELLSNCVRKLTKLKKLRIFASVSNELSIGLIGEIFSNIQDLSLVWLQVNDDCLNSLFVKLVQLKRVQIEGLPVSGACFASLPQNVKTIQFETSEDVNVALMFSTMRPQLKCLSLTANRLENSENFLKIVSKCTPNLEEFHLRLMWALLNVHCLNLEKLQCLSLTVGEIRGNIKQISIMQQLESLFLDVVDINEMNLMAIVAQCPNVKTIGISLSRSAHINLRGNFVNTLKCLKSLQELSIYDDNYNLRKYTVGTLNYDALVEAIIALHWISDLEIFIDSMDAIYVKSFIKAIKFIASKRNSCTFDVHINKERVEMCVSE